MEKINLTATEKLLIDLNAKIEGLWQLPYNVSDEVRATSFAEDKAIDVLLKGYKRMDSGRIQLPCLWKEDHPTIKSNYDYAKNRLLSLLQSKLLLQKDVFDMYQDVFTKWEQIGVIHRVIVPHPREEGYYWDHFPVCKFNRLTTKVRPVFDGAAKCGNICINDHFLKGPMLMNDLSKVLLRFCKYALSLIHI